MGSEHILLTLLAAQVIGALSPGPNTVLVIQSALHGRKFGLAASAGIWPVGVFWAAFGLAGLGALLTIFPVLSTIMKLACGSFLLWLAYKSIRHSFVKKSELAALHANHMTMAGVFRAGILTNITNPKSIAYFTSVFAATGASAIPVSYQIFAIVMMPSISFCYYMMLTLLASHKAVRSFLEHSGHWLDRVAGVVMGGFGLHLLLQVIS